jgi:hypothetical protein
MELVPSHSQDLASREFHYFFFFFLEGCKLAKKINERRRKRLIKMKNNSPLLECRENILRIVIVILIQSMMFHSSSHQPGAFGGFDESATARRDRLQIIISIQIVVSGPAPHVLNVGGRGAGEM